jgi:hypothetical protein
MAHEDLKLSLESRGWLSQKKVEEPVNNIILTHQAEA